MNDMIRWATSELLRVGYDLNDVEDGPNKWMAEHVIDLLKLFASQGHSGSSAPDAVALFEKLALYKPLSPLTGEDDEWMEVGSGVWQNRRDPEVFKEHDKNAYWMSGKVFWEWVSYNDMYEGKPFKSYFTCVDSKVDITFPWSRPDNPEYIFRPSAEFPEEIIE